MSDTKFLSTFLQSLRNKYTGVPVCLLVPNNQRGFMEQSLIDFCAVTGCEATVEQTSTMNWHEDVKQDLTYAKMCDAYISYGSWMPEFAAQGLLEPLSDRIRSSSNIDWLDIYPSVREGNARFKNEIYMVPLDGHVVEAVYRDDLIEQYGRTAPRTVAELADEAEFFNGKDLNGDSEPDFGICFSTKTGDVAGNMFWAIMAPFLQTLGMNEGVFFDPDTMEPKMREPIFRMAMDTYKRLVRASPFSSQGQTNWTVQNGYPYSYFDNGRCAFTFNFPGPVKMILFQQGAAKAANLTGKLSIRKLPGVACSVLGPRACPHGQDGVNYAPYYAGGGSSGQIRASADHVKKDAMFDFFTWMSDPEIGYLITANPGTLLDPFRRSHVEQLSNTASKVSQAFLEQGWEERQLVQLKNMVEDVFSHKNAALDLRVPGGYSYTEEETVKHLIDYWADTASLDQTIDAMVSGWNSVTETYGLDSQRKNYREGLGLGPYVPPAQAAVEARAATVFFAIAICLGSMIVVSCTGYTTKRFVMALRSERAQRKENERMAYENFMSLSRLDFNMVLISYSNFVQGGRLLKFETARELGLHTTLDTYEEANHFCRERVVVFLSHQWLGRSFPDPENVHFEAACTMLQLLISGYNLNPDMIYLWVDYTSIPQSNKMMLRMAIGSIQVYATLPKYFVCLVPDAKHDLGHECDAQSYLSRGWCRLEQWARVSVGGLDGMFSFTTAGGLLPVTRKTLTRLKTGFSQDPSEDWLGRAIQVCKGDFSDPDDRHRLKGVISALWMYAMLTKDEDSTVFDAVESDKQNVFPPEFFSSNYIAIAEGVAAKLKKTDWKKVFADVAELPVAEDSIEVSGCHRGRRQEVV